MVFHNLMGQNQYNVMYWVVSCHVVSSHKMMQDRFILILMIIFVYGIDFTAAFINEFQRNEFALSSNNITQVFRKLN